MATAEEIKVANKTSRNSPAVGAKALTPKMARMYMENNFKKDEARILDFGAGKHAIHAQAFVADGWDCQAYEFGDNVDPNIHSLFALSDKYDLVYASNVLNVQSNLTMLVETIMQIKAVMKEGAVFYANYPLEPRKSKMNAEAVRLVLQQHFDNVMWIEGKKNAPVWLMQDDK
jgi:hypothetical protein